MLKREEIEAASNVEPTYRMLFVDYIEHCRTNYLSPFNDGYTREYYRGEMIKLKSVLDEALSEKGATLDSKPD